MDLRLKHVLLPERHSGSHLAKVLACGRLGILAWVGWRGRQGRFRVLVFCCDTTNAH